MRHVDRGIGKWIGVEAMTKDTALDLALEAFIRAERDGYWSRDTAIAVEAIKQARSAPVQPVAFEVGLVEWVGNKLMATPKTTTTAPASWMEMVTANLVREGVNKHKSRELAEHFYSLKEKP
jgi:hypothetical protein